jgi:hypothetical protein
VATPVNQTPIFQSPLNKQRRDKFICVLTIPTILRDEVKAITRRNSSVNFDALQFSIFGAVAPPIEIPPIAVPFSGQTMKVTSYARPSFPHLKVNFTVDNQFNNYWVIYKWLQIFNNSKLSLFDPSKSYQDSLANQYMTNISIFGLDEYNERTAKFDYLRAFPIALEGINYNDRDATEMECAFEFAYHQLEMSLL